MGTVFLEILSFSWFSTPNIVSHKALICMNLATRFSPPVLYLSIWIWSHETFQEHRPIRHASNEVVFTTHHDFWFAKTTMLHSFEIVTQFHFTFYSHSFITGKDNMGFCLSIIIIFCEDVKTSQIRWLNKVNWFKSVNLQNRKEWIAHGTNG